MYSDSKYIATKRNIKFNITREEYDNLIQNKCYYCKNTNMKTSGLDRLDGTIKVYEKNNVVPSCQICNNMKQLMDEHNFIKHIRLIKQYANNNTIYQYKSYLYNNDAYMITYIVNNNLHIKYNQIIDNITKYIDMIVINTLTKVIYKICDKCHKLSELSNFIKNDYIDKICKLCDQ